MWYCGAEVLLPGGFAGTDVLVENGIIAAIGRCPPGEPRQDWPGCRIIPGLIDLHIHGFRGEYVMEAGAQGLCRMAEELASVGVTSFLATTVAAQEETLLPALRRLARAAASPGAGAVLRGIYLEGPFLSRTYKGAMREEALRAPEPDLLDRLCEAAGGFARIVTVAPELEGAAELIAACRERGLVASVGHTAAGYRQALEAFRAGAAHVTHLGNAMADFLHREPGVPGAAVEEAAGGGDVTAEIISDGHHLHPAYVRMLYRLLGEEHMILISDDTPISGRGDGRFVMDGRASFVKDGVCRLADGTINGNVQPLLVCVQRAAAFGVPLEAAVRMASLTPAKRLGIDGVTGSIAAGKRADLAVLDGAGAPVLTLVGGQTAYRAV